MPQHTHFVFVHEKSSKCPNSKSFLKVLFVGTEQKEKEFLSRFMNTNLHRN